MSNTLNDFVAKICTDPLLGSEIAKFTQEFVAEIADYAKCCECDVTFDDVATHLAQEVAVDEGCTGSAWADAIRLILACSKMPTVADSGEYETLGRGKLNTADIALLTAPPPKPDEIPVPEMQWWQFWNWFRARR